MYCQECGTENKDTAKFCKKCGNPFDPIEEIKDKTSNEIDRKALKIYLKNLLDLETMRTDINNSIIKAQASIESIKHLIFDVSKIKKPDIPRNEVRQKPNYFSIVIKPSLSLSLWFTALSFVVLLLFSVPFSILRVNTGFVPYFIIICIAIVSFFYKLSMCRDKYYEEMTSYERYVKNEPDLLYKSKMGLYESEVMKFKKDNAFYQSKIEEERIKLDKYKKENSETAPLISDMYSLNIIPTMFRSFAGVYSLYDIISSSDINLVDAMKLVKLEQIENKLDNAINLLEKSLYVQLNNNSLLKTINEDNRLFFNELLQKTDSLLHKADSLQNTLEVGNEHLSEIETYSKMSEYNTRLGAYIAASEYFEKYKSMPYANDLIPIDRRPNP